MITNFRYFFLKYNAAVLLSELNTGKILDINEYALSLFNKTTEDFSNLKRSDIFPQKAIKEIDKQLKNSNEPAVTETFILNKDRVKVNVNIQSDIITENDNNYIADILSLKEIKSPSPSPSEPESIDALKLVSESEIRYKSLFETANTAIFLLKNESIIEVNSRALETFACSREELIGKKPFDLSPEFQPDGSRSVEKVKENDRKAINGEPQFFEWQHKRSDGTLFDAEVSLNSIKIDNQDYIQAIVRDITQRKRIEQELVESRRSLSNLLKNLPGVAYRCKNDENWTMEFISEGCFILTGYYSEQLINNKELPYGDLIIEDDKKKVWHEIQEALENKNPFQLIYRIKTADEKIKWVWEQGSGIYSEKTGDLISIEGLINDITEQKKTEEALKQSETKFRSLVEESLVGVYIIQDGNFSYVNPRLAEIFGYSIEEILSSIAVDDLVNDEDKKKVLENISKQLKEEIKTIHYRFKGKKKDNSLIDLEVMGSKTVFDNKPAVIGTLLDITEKVDAEEKIRKLSRAVDQSPTSIIITDIDGNIEYVNEKFTEVTGYQFEEVNGKNPRVLKYGDTPNIYYKKLWESIKAGKEWHGELLNKKKSGELFWEFASISPIINSEGEITNFLAVKEDITERKNAEEEMRIAKDKAEDMNRLKSVFLANMSHELRTPMVAMLGYSEILMKEIDIPELQEMAKEIYESSHRLMNTLNLVLDLSKIEAKNEIVNYVELDLASIAAEEFELYKFLAARKNLYFKINLPKEPVVTLLDERMYRQIISSIVSNAVKFTNEGGITLSIYKQKGESANQAVVIKIHDTGIGIPPSRQNTIFEAFRQISEGLNRSFEGTGLGLTVAKKFIEMMDGNINVESEFGKGSTFTITFPIIRRFEIEQIHRDPMQIIIEFPETERQSKFPHILIVEDDLSNAGVIKFFLQSKFKVDVVMTGEEGTETVKTKKYAAVLMDIDLGSGMTGLDAAKKIRETPGYSNIPIVAVTALAMRGDKEKFLTEGCTHYISKPFKKDDLLNLIEQAIQQAKEKIISKFSGD